ncbi:MAG TPA: hypothetical protein ENK11_07280, partial [Phycisphaerales bacterium]|nr:hypothetical protein [Phycisphaerales bacterium]
MRKIPAIVRRLVGMTETGFALNRMPRWFMHRLLLFVLAGAVGLIVFLEVVSWFPVTPPAPAPFVPTASPAPPAAGVPGGVVPPSSPWWTKLLASFFGVQMAMLAAVALVVVGLFLFMRRAVRRAGGYACPRCLYDLSAVEVTRCP